MKTICPRCYKETEHEPTGAMAFVDGTRNGKRVGWRQFEVRCTICATTHWWDEGPPKDYKNALMRKKTFGD